MQQHPVTGYARMISLDVEEQPVLDLICYHHERVDGLGYPFGLRGDDIPLSARFFAVVDTFDAMTSHRPYRHEVGKDAADRAIVEIKSGIGTRYDREAVDLFASLYDEGRLDWILNYFNDGSEIPAFCTTAEMPSSK
ncbi:MAG: HD domain-containing phosphohydrolase [Planctomycetota bacterium]